MANREGTKQSKAPLIGIGCSALMVVAALVVTAGAALAPAFTNGRASVDESLPVMLGGGACCFFAGLLMVAAIVWFVTSRKGDGIRG